MITKLPTKVIYFLDSSSEPQDLGGPTSDQRLSDDVNRMIVAFKEERNCRISENSTENQTFQCGGGNSAIYASCSMSKIKNNSNSRNDDEDRVKTWKLWKRYFEEMRGDTEKIEKWKINDLVKPRKPPVNFPDLANKTPKENLQLTEWDLHNYFVRHFIADEKKVQSLDILRENASSEEAKEILEKADSALRSANRQLLTVSLEAGINFERGFEIHQAEKTNKCITY